jgi:uncharacterized membrane protein YkoI
MRRVRPILLGLLAAAAWPAAARADEGATRAREGVEGRQIVTLESLVSFLEAHYAGRFVEAELEHRHGRPIYEIEWRSPEGRMLEFEFDAQTGELLERERHGWRGGHRR